ncbi:cytochrome P450 [Lentinula edodes]|nr:cytochrome P450 [Lentinula edodes]
MHFLSSSFAVGIPVLMWLLASTVRSYFERRKMPPGPLGIPILGNLFQMPTQIPWIYFQKFSQSYGQHTPFPRYPRWPIISFNVVGHTVVVLNSHKSAYELLELRSTLYSDRPRFIMAGELLCGGIMLSFISYGGLFRRMRRACNNTFGQHSSKQFQPLQEAEAVQLIIELASHPTAWEEIIKRSTSANILTATYGWLRSTKEHAPLVKRIHAHTARLANSCIPGSSMVDIFPIINNIPGWMAKWKRDALAWHQHESEMFESFNADVERKIAYGVAKACFVTDLVEGKERNKLSKKEAAWLAGIMFSAGAETTTASISNFFIAMIHFPKVMHKAQHEIDEVVGRDRAPTFADLPHLPYIQALVKELLRWRPAGPMGIPRKAAQDDWYEGYFIPKGATVISNIWYVSYSINWITSEDLAIYTDPENFRPERFLDGTGMSNTSPTNMHSIGHSSFGFGRRSCVGATFATQSLFINFACLLWAFNIEKGYDDNGNESLPSLTDVIDAGVVVGPAPFKCKITIRCKDTTGPLLERLNTDS